MQTLILSRHDVESLADMGDVVAAVERAFLSHAEGSARMPPKVYLDLPEYRGDFRAMPAYMDGSAGVKWVNSHPHNPKLHDLPSVMGLYVLSDPRTARPLAIMDATWLTALRTGAAAAVASRALARKGALSIGFVGAGVQARTIAMAHQVTHPHIKELVFADRRPEAASALVERYGGRVGSVSEAAACDIVCTSTPGSVPVIKRAMIRPGAHINAMGADAEGKQELEAALLLSARIIVDDPVQAIHSGEINVPIHLGALAVDDIAGGLGDVIANNIIGRTSADEVTIFDSTGLAVQDLATARLVYERALEREVGTALNIV